MILYTVLPEEYVTAGLSLGEGEAGPPSREVAVRGGSGPVTLVLEGGPGSGWRIGRLISSDPFDFLDPAFAPGRTVPERFL
ncbi:MAG TPA: hypothetical protein DHW14_06445 [Clostridiales bacterium]|nr:hypothetical protein [Clostridiales bacterium]